jgi:hypothetical protein
MVVVRGSGVVPRPSLLSCYKSATYGALGPASAWAATSYIVKKTKKDLTRHPKKCILVLL